MRKLMTIALLVALTGCGDAKQNEKKAPETDKGKETASVIPATPIVPSVKDPQEENSEEQSEEEAATESADSIASVMKEYDTAMQAFMKKYSAADEKDKGELVKNELPKPDDFAGRLMEMISEDPSTEEAAEGLMWVSRRARGEHGAEAGKMLLKHHLDSEVMADMANGKSRETPTIDNQQFLKDLVEKSPVERVKGVASYALVMQLKNAERTFQYYQDQLTTAKNQAGDDKDEDGEKGNADQPMPPPMSVKQAQKSFDDFVKDLAPDTLEFLKTGKTSDGNNLETMLEKVHEDFADVVLSVRNGKETLIGTKCEGTLFELRNLVIGKTAPDIEGEDLDGESFKLSDYRGKVVVIDFWGDW